MSTEEKTQEEGPVTYIKSLPCPLTMKEVNEQALSLADLMSQKEQIEADAKAKADEYKAQVKNVEKSMLEVRRRIDMKTIMRDVKVIEIPNNETKEVEIHRLDRKRNSPERICGRRAMNQRG